MYKRISFRLTLAVKIPAFMAFILAIRSHVTVPNVPLYDVTIDSTLEDNIRENLSLVPEKK
jgi:hypothetical protein